MKNSIRNISWDRGVGILLIFTILFGWFISPDFANSSNFGFITQDIGEFLILAMPIAFLIIAGEIDLSIGSGLSLVSCTIGYCYRSHMSFTLALAVGVLSGLACGAFNGFLVTYLGLPSLAVTIGTLGLYRGLCYVLLGNNPVNQLPNFWTNLGVNNIPGTFLPWTFLFILPCIVLALITLHYTKWGRWCYLTGINQEAAKFTGIPVKKYKFFLFVFTGFYVAIAAIVYTVRFASASPDSATGYELSVIAAVLFGGVSIAGGIGNMWGVIFSVVELGVIRSVLQLVNFSANALQIVSGALLIFSVALPKGIEKLKTLRELRAAKNELTPTVVKVNK
jgi:rhamnose transport system permease protein